MASTRTLRFALQVGDICQFDADVIAAKYAERLLGAAFALARSLQLSGEDIHRMLPLPGDMHLFSSGGRIRAGACCSVTCPWPARVLQQGITAAAR